MNFCKYGGSDFIQTFTLLFDKLRRRNKSNIVSIKTIKTVQNLTLECFKQF